MTHHMTHQICISGKLLTITGPWNGAVGALLVGRVLCALICELGLWTEDTFFEAEGSVLEDRSPREGCFERRSLAKSSSSGEGSFIHILSNFNKSNNDGVGPISNGSGFVDLSMINYA